MNCLKAHFPYDQAKRVNHKVWLDLAFELIKARISLKNEDELIRKSWLSNVRKFLSWKILEQDLNARQMRSSKR